jgi:hypothetical protein
MNQRKNYHGTITAVFNTTGNPAEGPADTVRYDAVVDEEAGADSGRINAALQNHLPLRRQWRGTTIIIAALPGDPCTIAVRGANVFLYPYTEGIAPEEACP